MSSLKSAIQMDSSLAKMAATDLEFFKYFEICVFECNLLSFKNRENLGRGGG